MIISYLKAKVLVLFVLSLFVFESSSINSQTMRQTTALGLKTNDAETDSLSWAFHIAMGDIYSNIRIRKTGNPKTDAPLLFAGLDYNGAWTRDISISAWNGAAMIFPDIIKNSLNEVLIGDSIIGGQYWDNLIWTLGAWHYYLYSGDKPFLKKAYYAICRTLKNREQNEYESKYGLFRGAAVYGDGISAYDEEYTHTGEPNGGLWLSNIDKWIEANPLKKATTGEGLPMMVLSTNAVYYQTYIILSKIEHELGLKVNEQWEMKAKNLKLAINTHLWNKNRKTYDYYIDPWKTDHHQEALGIAFALLFQIADSTMASQVIKNCYVSPAGIPCVYPSYERYRTDSVSYGRHSGVVWAHAQGFWADAAAQFGGFSNFEHEYLTLTKEAIRDMQFREIYHPTTTLPYGGLQEDGFTQNNIRLWKSTERQTWSATAYLRMVLNVLIGIKPSVEGISFKSYLPVEFENFRLLNIPYRNCILNLYLKGKGHIIKQCKINGKISQPFIKANERGTKTIEIVLGNE